MIQLDSTAKEWIFTGFYAHPEVAKRPGSWSLLRHLATLAPGSNASLSSSSRGQWPG